MQMINLECILSFKTNQMSFELTTLLMWSHYKDNKGFARFGVY